MSKILNRPLMVDFHTHCDYSPDSSTPMKEMIEKAIEIGITDLAFTDHVDLDADIDAETIQNWDFDRDDHERAIDRFKREFEGKIKLYNGLEIGMQPHLGKENTEIVSKNNYDFVIASIHSVEKKDLYYRRYFENHSDKEAVQIYFQEFFQSLKTFNDYCVLGHLDLYLRYKSELSSVKFSDYDDIVYEIYKHIIHSGKGIELNAGGHRYGIGHNNPHNHLLKLYKDMHGEILTLGSDAHKPIDLGYHYKENIELIQSLGFKYICTFNNMKPVFHKL